MRSVESTALRVLRGLEEEGQKLKSAAVTVHVAAEVAIYTLNQKRRELARIESDYGMTIVFEPKEGLMAGSFEIERTAQKTLDEAAKVPAALKMDAAPAAVEEEPEISVEADEEAEDEEERPSQPRGQEGLPGAQPGGSSKRRRRRRGGRGHGDRTHQGQHAHVQAPQQLPQPGAQALQAEAPADVIVAPAQTDASGADPNASSSQPGQPGSPKRKRRRRRGKRGGSGHSSGSPGAQPTGLPDGLSSNGHDRFGVPDEIDTTPHEEPIRLPAIEPRDPDAPVATPNAASSPVWSLTVDQGRSPPEAIRDAKERPESVSSEPAAPAGPPKKGWWQRTFRTEG